MNLLTGQKKAGPKEDPKLEDRKGWKSSKNTSKNYKRDKSRDGAWKYENPDGSKTMTKG